MDYSGKLSILVSVNNSIIVIDLTLPSAVYLIERFDNEYFPSFILVHVMMALFLVWVVPVVLVPAGFKFLRFMYAKLWLIIKVVFHSGDWEIGLETLLFFEFCFLSLLVMME